MPSRYTYTSDERFRAIHKVFKSNFCCKTATFINMPVFFDTNWFLSVALSDSMTFLHKNRKSNHIIDESCWHSESGIGQLMQWFLSFFISNMINSFFWKGSLWGLPAPDSSSQGGFSFVIWCWCLWWCWCLFSNAGYIVCGWVGDSDFGDQTLFDISSKYEIPEKKTNWE